MSEVVGVVFAIVMAVIAVVAVLFYVYLTRFLDNLKDQTTRLTSATEDIAKKASETLGKVDEALTEFKLISATIREKAEVIERDIIPLVKVIDQTLSDARPLITAMGESSDGFRRSVNNIGRVSSDIAEVTSGVRDVLIPAVNNLRGIIFGLSEGVKMLRLGRNDDRK